MMINFFLIVIGFLLLTLFLNKIYFDAHPSNRVLTWVLTLIIFFISLAITTLIRIKWYADMNEIYGQFKPNRNPLDFGSGFLCSYIFYTLLNKKSYKDNSTNAIGSDGKSKSTFKNKKLQVIGFIAVILFFLIVYFFASINEKKTWIQYFNEAGINYYYDSNSLQRVDGGGVVTTGFNITNKTSGKQQFREITYIYDCGDRRVRIIKIQTFEESKENDIGKVIETKEYPIKKQSNVWDVLEQWFYVTEQGAGSSLLGTLCSK